MGYGDVELSPGLQEGLSGESPSVASWDPNADEPIKASEYKPEKGMEQSEEVSPYPEVAASVSAKDDEEGTPCNTFRVWFLGMLFVTIGSGLNILFSMRNPSIIITSIVCQLLSFPLGRGLAKIPGPRWFNPGPFTMKEHAIITIMSNVSFAGGQVYASSIIMAQKQFYKQDFGWGFQILLCWSTQIIGYGLAGVARKYLVWPAAMIWPSNLVQCALFRTLHREAEPIVPGWTVSRYRLFLYAMAGSFVWYWFPGYLFQALSAFAFVTWIVPNNKKANIVFGQFTGMSLFPLTFDWTQIAGYVTSPLQTPWWAIANILGATIMWFWIVSPAIYFSNAWYTQYVPFSTPASYDNTQGTYNVTRILTDKLTFDPQKYKEYSSLYLSTTFALSYGLSFATMMAVITHTILYYGKDVIKKIRTSRNEEPDVYYKLSRRYAEVPDWWYLVIFVVMFGVSMVVVEAWDTHLPWWGLIIALLIAAVWFLPIGFIQAVTNTQLGLNVITEFIVGYMLPGRPLAMMMFKTYGYITMSQGMYFVSDLKLGHYMKVPPRTLFFTQTIATLWACVVELGVMNWMLGHVEGICTPEQADKFVCNQSLVFFNASIIWGVIGPSNIFSSGKMYDGLLYFFLIGALVPIPTWLMYKKYPNSFWKYVNWPLIFGGTGLIPPATPLNYLSWAIVGFIFNKYIKQRFRGWWLKYNYILSAGLDTGLAISTIIIFLCLSLTKVTPPEWWGNNQIYETLDVTAGTNLLDIPEGKTHFGPDCWYDCN